MRAAVAKTRDDATRRVLDVARTLLDDLHGADYVGPPLTLDSTLDQDLGLDSLARVELLQRLEQVFGVDLPDETLSRANTLRDLLAALRAGTVRSEHRPPSHAARIIAPSDEPAVRQRAPPRARTLPAVLEWHVEHHPDKLHIVCCEEGAEAPITYAKLWREAQAIAGGLQSRGVEPQHTVAVMLPTGPDYFIAYFGILIAGGIPVPIYPPARPVQIEEHVRRHTGILSNANTTLLITVPEARGVARLLESGVPSLRRVVTVKDLAEGDQLPSKVPYHAQDIALLQYTSGSTGQPKGVTLTHANLLANIRAMGQAVRVNVSDVFVSWLPLYHDMGLISAWLANFYFANPLVVMSPLRFLARPARWLWAIHQYRGTLTAAPNFAFELCARRIDEGELAGLDLSSLRFAANGAEPVNPDTLERFHARFAKFGLRADALAPVYGLAESTVALTCPPLGRGVVVDHIQRERFVREATAVPADRDDPNPLQFVACGHPLPGFEVRVVDATGREVGERVEGRLEFKGPSATHGYYRNPQETARLFHGDWLDSGDRAYIAAGDVYITGRVKDIIIRGGRNLYPHEIEAAVGEVPGVRKGCVAAFGSADPDSGTERLVVLAETRETKAADLAILRANVNNAVSSLLGEPPDDVVLTPPHTVLKTSSGKIRRAASREAYEQGTIGAPARAVWWQIVRLVLTAAIPRARSAWRVIKDVGYATYVAALFCLIGPVMWLLTALTPRPNWVWRMNHLAARLLLWLARIALRVEGLDNLSARKPRVLVANHASYLDGLVLLAALPHPGRFVAKRELREQLLAGIYLRRLGTEFVERFEIGESVDDAHRLAREAPGNDALVFFPEGTCRRLPGLLPFHLGAFIVAVEQRLPVVPIAIRGTRSILRPEQWFPRRGAVTVVIGAPVLTHADADDAFAGALEVRTAARVKILAHCREPDLEDISL